MDSDSEIALLHNSRKRLFKDGGVEARDGRDLRKAQVEGDQFRPMMDGEGRDEEVERAAVDAMLAAFPAKCGGIAPKLRWGGQKRECGELGHDLLAFDVGGMAQHL